MAKSLIQLSSVSKRFGSQDVLRELSFAVQPGEILGLLGPNGSGKTTTIRLINGVMRPSGGSITVNGYDPLHDGEAIRRLSGILTESAAFYQHMSGLENLRFYGELYGVRDAKRAPALLEQFGLAEAADRKVGQYSTGMKKRLGLAKALLHRPPILFLDEPTNGLDPEGIRMVLDAIVDLNRRDGTTILLCSHLLDQLERVCSRYLFIDRGRLIESGTLPELEARYLHGVLLQAETNLPLTGETYQGIPAKRLAPNRIEFTLPGKEAIPALLRQLTQDGAVYEATVVNQDLESIYFRIKEAARA